MAYFIFTQVEVLAAGSDSYHPNKVPFSGVLCQLDQPSTRPPGNSAGLAKRVLLPRAVAEAALDSLLGMGVNVTMNLDGHDRTNKIGVITAAWIEGNEIKVSGHLFGKDFPQEIAAVQAGAKQGKLGMSFELLAAFEDLSANILKAEEVIFTGAAILLKDKAAYGLTSVAASWSGEGDEPMAIDEKKLQEMMDNQTKVVTEAAEAITEAVKSLTAVAASIGDAVKAVQEVAAAAKATEKVDAMSDDKAKAEENKTVMAASAVDAKLDKLCDAIGDLVKIQAEAVKLGEKKGGEKTEIMATTDVDVKADDYGKTEAVKRDSKTMVEAAVKRSSLPSAFVSKFNDAVDKDGKITVSKLDEVFAAANIPTSERFRIKSELRQQDMLILG
jgi:hypothetical protein